jgi:UDP:flavonoid glycosyltransferase YjiC (YdhE family)
MFSDKPYWASSVRELAIGTSVPIAELTDDRLSDALQVVSSRRIAERARAIAVRIARDGAAVAERHLVDSAN